MGAGSLMKTQLPKRGCDIEESDIRPEYRTISCELRALAKMVHQEFSSRDDDPPLLNSFCANRSPLFERGRFYEEYSARRNERLKRKKGEAGDETKAGYDLGVRVESAKRRDTNSKRFESLRKTVPCTPMTERTQAPSSSRYLLRSSTIKENKKPPYTVNTEMSSGIGEKKIGVRRARKN